MAPRAVDEGANYHIRVQGRLESSWAARLGDLTLVVREEDGRDVVTELSGWVVDQAALMGVLEQLYAMNMTLLRVERVE
jgi:hypothetical protein